MVESKTGTTGVVTGGGQGSVQKAVPPKVPAKSENTGPIATGVHDPRTPKDKQALFEKMVEGGPWHPAFPPPGDGDYEVKWSDDEVVKATRANGVWKLKDGRPINVHAWRPRWDP